MSKIIFHNLNEAMIYSAASETFRIKKGTLYEYGVNPSEVWAIMLRGTNQSWDSNDVLSMPTCIKNAMGRPNNYLSAVKKSAIEQIPEGANVMLIGHSLGGMVAQQFIADEEMMSQFNLLNALAIGSPYVIKRKRGCPLHRCCERGDIVSTLSLPMLANMIVGHVRTEAGGYYFNFLGAHCESYRYSPVWNEYDVFGVPYGRRTFEFEDEE